MSDKPTAFADLLRAFRRARGMTQEELAGLARLGTRSVSDLERGISVAPRRDTVTLLAGALNLTPQQLVDFETAARAGRASLMAPHDSEPSVATGPPLLPTPLIGRDHDAAAIAKIVSSADPRLVTLTGPPGIGKTSLAIHVGRLLTATFPGGVAFVALAEVRHPDLILPAIAGSLGLTAVQHEPWQTTIGRRLNSRRTLLLLDNLEQVDAGPLLADLVASGPEVRLLATSRALLRIRAEHEYVVGPLDLPDVDATVESADVPRFSGLQLFVARARTTHGFVLPNGGAAVLARICHRLGGVPLAIELAAARVRELSLEQTLTRLDHSLSLLVDGARDLPDRQRSLRSAIAWSHELLTPAEQRLLARLSVFAGGWTLESAEQVYGDDNATDVLIGLTSLSEKSLIQRTAADGKVRFHLLEAIREFAAEQLASGDLELVARGRHAVYFAKVAKEGEAALQDGRQAVWLSRLDDELDNIRAALRFAWATGNSQLGLAIAGTMWRFWEIRSLLDEGRSWLHDMLALDDKTKKGGAGQLGNPGFRMAALAGAGQLALRQGDYDASAAMMKAALALARELDDLTSIARALNGLGNVAVYRGLYEEAVRLYHETLTIARRTGVARTIAVVLGNLAFVANERGEYDQAQALALESLGLRRQVNDASGVATVLGTLADIALHRGDYDVSASYVDQALAITLEQRSPLGGAYAVLTLAQGALRQDDPDRSLHLAEECLERFRSAGDRRGCVQALHTAGEAALAGPDPEQASVYLEEALTQAVEIRDRPGVISALEAQARLAAHHDAADDEARLYGLALILREALELPIWLADRFAHEERIAALGGRDAVVAAAIGRLQTGPINIAALLPGDPVATPIAAAIKTGRDSARSAAQLGSVGGAPEEVLRP